jgi:exodeoxyribonuclease VII small subunit
MSKNDKETVSEKMIRLQELVAWFESDEFVLEQATEQYAKAAALAEEIEKELNEYKNEIVVLSKRFDQES